MNRSIVSLLFIITIINISTAKIIAEQHITPWLVLIKKYNLIDDSDTLDYHCVGVLIEQDVVVTSADCFDKFPQNTQMILFAGSLSSRLNWNDNTIQIYSPVGVKTVTNQIISLSISPPIQQTKYVNYIAACKQQNCLFDNKYGFQYGYDLNQNYYNEEDLQMIMYDFSNSNALCLEINESAENKYCTPFNCEKNQKNNGGEPLTKVYKGQSYLMGFWHYDLCSYERGVRVFNKFSYDEPITEVDNTQNV